MDYTLNDKIVWCLFELHPQAAAPCQTVRECPISISFFTEVTTTAGIISVGVILALSATVGFPTMHLNPIYKYDSDD